MHDYISQLKRKAFHHVPCTKARQSPQPFVGNGPSKRIEHITFQGRVVIPKVLPWAPLRVSAPMSEHFPDFGLSMRASGGSQHVFGLSQVPARISLHCQLQNT